MELRDANGEDADGEHVHVHVHVHTPAERNAATRSVQAKAPTNTSSDTPTDDAAADHNNGEKSDKPDNDDNKEDDKKDEPRKRWPLILLLVVITLGIIIGFIYWFLTRDLISTDDAYTDGRAVIIAPHISGYVTILAVNDNQFVHKGDLLIQIEPSDYIAARDQAAGQIAALDAQLTNARITVGKAHQTYPAQLKQAQGQLMQAKGQLFQANADFRRQHAVERAATSQQNVDTATASRLQALGQVQQAEAQVEQAGLVNQNIAQAEAQVKQLDAQAAQAKANYEQAEINLGYTRITAPQDGWITKRNVEKGAYAQSGSQVLALVTPEIWVTANFKENELTRMRPGQHVSIKIDAYPNLDVKGHVDSIQHGSGSKFTAFPPENATGNYVKIVQRVPVKIVVDSGIDLRAPPPLGLSVEPTVTLE